MVFKGEQGDQILTLRIQGRGSRRDGGGQHETRGEAALEVQPMG